MSVVSACGIRMAYEFSGSDAAPVIVFAHSLAADRAMWRAQMRAFSGRFRCLAYDIRGHGETSAPEGDYTMDGLADDVVGLLDALGIDKVHFVGLSLGGMIGQCVAARHGDRLLSLTLCATTSAMPRDLWAQRISQATRDGMESLAEDALERWFTAAFRRRNPDGLAALRRIIASTPVAGYTGCAAAIRDMDLVPLLGRIAVPTLVIVGTEDRSTPIDAAEALHRAIKGSALTIVPGAAHLINIEDSTGFNQALDSFLTAWSEMPAPGVRGPATCVQ